MKTIKRWFKNLKWLFNHPPTSITSEMPEDTKCDYCGYKGWSIDDNNSLWLTSASCICEKCRKKVFDAILIVSGEESK